MSISTLPPVGRRITLMGGGGMPYFPGFESFYTQSGTAALSQALMSSKQLLADKLKDSVVLPAYGCPDLIAATIYAGLKPVLVDIHPNDPAYDLDLVSRVLSSGKICAVVAVNFLGIKENLSELKRLCQTAGALLVEDNAQWFPEEYLSNQSLADFVITSFGRGKPVNLLSGGLLLVRKEYITRIQGLQRLQLSQKIDARPSTSFQIKSVLFNTMLSPVFFGVLSRVPFLGVGSTIYHPLKEIEPGSVDALTCLPCNLKSYLEAERWREEKFRSGLATKVGVIDLAHFTGRAGRLLRYPILLNQEKRDHLLNSSFGVSALYKIPLLEITGVADALAAAEASNQMMTPGAKEFAARLCTLPLHEGVTERHIGHLLDYI